MLSCPKSFGHRSSGSWGQKKDRFFSASPNLLEVLSVSKAIFLWPSNTINLDSIDTILPDKLYKWWSVQKMRFGKHTMAKKFAIFLKTTIKNFYALSKGPNSFFEVSQSRPMLSEWWIPVVLGKHQNQKKINGWQDRKFTVNPSLSALIFQQSRCLLQQNHGPLQIWFVPSHLTFPRWIKDSVWISAHKT